MEIPLSNAEKELLLKILDQYYLNLRGEIYKTEAHGIKTELKEEESVLKSLLDRLRE